MNKPNEDKKEKALAEEVMSDFKRRQEERRVSERSWQLNMNFLSGNQYCDINALGEIENSPEGYAWQQRRVFNRIAPIVDTRCAKLGRIRPRLTVRPASDSEEDRRSAKISSALLNAAYEDCDVDGAITAATVWAETCGTAFYKIIWDGSAGNEVGVTADGISLRDGKIRVIPLSPFEIYPYTLSEEKVENQPSIIHARAVSAQDIRAAYGVEIEGRDIDEFTLSPISSTSHSLREGARPRAVRRGYEVVVERYSRPTVDDPDGRLTVVAGDKVLYDGALPYKNGEDGTRGYPFVKQCCIPLAGSFFGGSIVDRLIPVQRAYNAVKNRKHEFLNRISMGTVAVEDGSVDTDELAEDGLAPGKIIIYRQGGTPPQMLTMGSVPAEFTEEEGKLEEEFSDVSGTGELTQKANSFSSVTSATGLQLIVEQDDARLAVCYEQIRVALRKIGRHVLRLYRQFASVARMVRVSDGDSTGVISFKASDVSGDDVIFEADSELNLTPARRRAVIYDMLEKGLFTDESGKVPTSVKNKIVEELGFKGFAKVRDVAELNRKRCAKENAALKGGEKVEVREYDDHAVHIEEHTAFLLTEELSGEEEARVCEHLQQHRNLLNNLNTEVIKNGQS